MADRTKGLSAVDRNSTSSNWTLPGFSSAASAALVASGITFGFLIGWLLRGSRAPAEFARPLQKIVGVGKYLFKHGNVPTTKLALVVRSDIQMTKGKIAAQCGHAAIAAVQEFSLDDRELLNLWLTTGQTKVVLKINGEEGLLRLAKKATSLGVNSYVIRDAGRTEVQSGTATVVAVGPAEGKRVDAVTGSLSLL